MAVKRKIIENDSPPKKQQVIIGYAAGINVTDEEAAILREVQGQIAKNVEEGKPIDYSVDRLKFAKVAKIITPFADIIKHFIEDQKGRGNSPITIKHYEQTIRKLEKFFCW